MDQSNFMENLRFVTSIYKAIKHNSTSISSRANAVPKTGQRKIVGHGVSKPIL